MTPCINVWQYVKLMAGHCNRPLTITERRCLRFISVDLLMIDKEIIKSVSRREVSRQEVAAHRQYRKKSKKLTKKYPSEGWFIAPYRLDCTEYYSAYYNTFNTLQI